MLRASMESWELVREENACMFDEVFVRGTNNTFRSAEKYVECRVVMGAPERMGLVGG